MRATLKFASLFIALLLATAAGADSKFEKVFDGKTLDGWMLVGGAGPGYVVKDGILLCPKDGGGNLITTKQYTDFVFKFDFKTDPGGNNGVGLRTPTEGNLSYTGMESQILDDDHPMYATLQPWQYHGSLYGIVAAKRGALKKAGE